MLSIVEHFSQFRAKRTKSKGHPVHTNQVPEPSLERRWRRGLVFSLSLEEFTAFERRAPFAWCLALQGRPPLALGFRSGGR